MLTRKAKGDKGKLSPLKKTVNLLRLDQYFKSNWARVNKLHAWTVDSMNGSTVAKYSLPSWVKMMYMSISPCLFHSLFPCPIHIHGFYQKLQ